jgi:hypothetical protein
VARSHAQPSVLQAGTEFADSLEHTYNTFVFSSALQEALSASGFAVSNHTYSATPPAVTPASETAAAAAAAAAVEADSGSGSSSGWADLGGSVRFCVNVHAVLHSPRGDGKEALVLVTPINHQHFSTGTPAADAWLPKDAWYYAIQQYYGSQLIWQPCAAFIVPPC